MKFKNKASLLLARCFVLSDIKLDKLSERRACERESEQIRAYDIFQNTLGVWSGSAVIGGRVVKILDIISSCTSY